MVDKNENLLQYHQQDFEFTIRMFHRYLDESWRNKDQHQPSSCVVILMAALCCIALTLNVEAAPEATQSPQSPVAELLKRGHLNIQAGQPEEALLQARKAIERDSQSAEAYFLLARAEQDLGLKADAMKNYDKAIGLNPELAKAYSNRALLKGALGDMKGALKDLNRAIAIDKQFAVAYLNRGVTNGALNNKKAALEDFDKAIRINKSYTDAYRNRGITKELLGDLKGACADWNMAASLGAKDVRQWYLQQCKR